MQKVDKKKKEREKVSERAIHCTPKHITHDYYSSLCVHIEQDKWVVNKAVVRYASLSPHRDFCILDSVQIPAHSLY